MARVIHMSAAGRPPFALRARNRSPEDNLQKHIVRQLRAYMPPEVWWACSLSGVQLTPQVASQAKAMGMERGAPDLSFVFPDGVTRYIELKGPDGSLSTEQKRLALILSGIDCFRVARSWEEARGHLERWLALYDLRFLTDAEAVRRGTLR